MVPQLYMMTKKGGEVFLALGIRVPFTTFCMLQFDLNLIRMETT